MHPKKHPDRSKQTFEQRYRWRFANDQVEYDEVARQLLLQNERVALEHKPGKLLGLLLRHANAVVPHETIRSIVWLDRPTTDNVVASAINKIRNALSGLEGVSIKNVSGVGYQLLSDVSSVLLAAEPANSTLLVAGTPLAERPDFVLERCLRQSTHGETWLARRAADQAARVYKFALTDAQIDKLKYDAAQADKIHARLGERDDILPVLSSNFFASPYFLESEYQSVDLRAWAAQHGVSSSLKQRLQVFCQLAQAVATVHAVGVLHQRLKPENITIGPTQRTGQPWQARVADFGAEYEAVPDKLEFDALGKATTAIPISASMYLAPELLTGRATAQSDVYALGVLLYQCAIGDFARPLTTGWQRELDDPLLITDIAAATEAQPMHRIASASALLVQVQSLEQRHAAQAEQHAQATQLAQAQAALLRLRARRRWLLAAVSVLLFALGATAFLYRQAETARQAAERYAQSTEAVERFVVDDIFGQSNPADARFDRKAEFSAVLEKASENLAQRFPDPLARAALHRTLGNAHRSLGNREPAHAHLEQARTLFAQELDPQHPLHLAVSYRLAISYAMDSQFLRSETLLEATDELAGALLQAPTALAVEANYARGDIAHLQLKPTEALPAFERVLALHVDGAPIEQNMLESARINQIDALLRLQRNDEALALLKQLAATESSMLLSSKPILHRLFLRAYRAEKQFDLALKHGERAVAISEEAYGVDDFDSIVILSSLSYLYEVVKDCPKALQSAELVYERMQKRFGKEKQGTLIELGNRGSRRLTCGQLDTAIMDLRDASQGLRQHYGKNNVPANSFSSSLARALGKAGRHSEGLAELEQMSENAAEAIRAGGGKIVNQTELDLIRAELLFGAGRNVEAVPLLQAVLTSLALPDADAELREQASALQKSRCAAGDAVFCER